MPRTNKLRRSTAFKMGAIFALVLCASVALMGSFVYWTTVGFMERETNTVIETDIEGLAEVYQRRGLGGLVATIEQRIDRDPVRSSIYLLADAKRTPVAGNISAWPDSAADADGWIEFGLTDRNTATHTRARARPFLLRGGFNLLVGRDIRNLREIKRLIEDALKLGMMFAIVLGSIAGWFLSRRLRKRLLGITETSREVMRGDLSKRVAALDRDDDLDEVAHSLNAMLSEVQSLMLGIEQLSNNIAHDLRTPLARVRNRLVQLRDRRDEPRDLNIEVDACVAELDQLLATFAALLRISRLEAVGSESVHEPFDLEQLCFDALELYEPLATQKNIDIEVQTSAMQVSGDRELILQALCNLVDNALKYSPQSSLIQLSLKQSANGPVLSIVDRGIGIASDEKGRVFERFYRGERARGSHGTGLGLSLVRAVCSAHGIVVELSDANPGLRVELTFAA